MLNQVGTPYIIIGKRDQLERKDIERNEKQTQSKMFKQTVSVVTPLRSTERHHIKFPIIDLCYFEDLLIEGSHLSTKLTVTYDIAR